MTGANDEILPDAGAILADMALLSVLAGNEGKLVIASYGENTDTGTNLSPRIMQFKPSEKEAAAARFTELSREPHRNVYIMLATVRDDLDTSKKGGEKDVVSVFGLVADFDAKNDAEAENWQARLPMRPTMVLETSRLPAPSYQCRFLFKKPIDPERAKKLAINLVQYCGCDPVSKDVSHVWRCAGGLNKPNRNKISNGRPTYVRIYADGRYFRTCFVLRMGDGRQWQIGIR